MPSAERRRRHARRLVEAGYNAVLKDPTASPEQKLAAADGLAKIQARRDRQAVKANLLEMVNAPPAELSPEEQAALQAELQRRGLDGPKNGVCAFPQCDGTAPAWYVRDDRTFCYRHVPVLPRTNRMEPLRCAGNPACPNDPWAHHKAGKRYCWTCYPDKPQSLK